jgi:hypothetical protein
MPYVYETIESQQQKRKVAALKEEGEDVFQLDRFENAYHQTLQRMGLIIKAEREFRKRNEVCK